jgi:hypothetical protein
MAVLARGCSGLGGLGAALGAWEGACLCERSAAPGPAVLRLVPEHLAAASRAHCNYSTRPTGHLVTRAAQWAGQAGYYNMKGVHEPFVLRRAGSFMSL